MQNLTTLQATMLKQIAESEHNQFNGGIPKTLSDVGQIWTRTIVKTIQDKGTFTSLINAGLVWSYWAGTSDAVIQLSPEGFEAYKSLSEAAA